MDKGNREMKKRNAKNLIEKRKGVKEDGHGSG